MAYSLKEKPCADCGTIVKGRFSSHAEVRCINCAADNMARAAREMANKCGPAYDKWLQTRGPQGRPRTK